MKEEYNKAAVQSIANSIVTVFRKSLPVYDYIGNIMGKDSKPNHYKVIINKNEYVIKNGTVIDFSIGDRCLIYCISGNFNNKVIIAKL